MSGDITDVALKQVIGECVQEESGLYMISIRQKEELEESVFNAIRRLDVLQELLEDDTITEIMINGKDDIFLERNGHITKWDKSFENEERLEDIAQKIASLSNKIVNISSPIADTRLEDGSRVSIVLPPVALNGPIITIRKFYKDALTMEKLIETGSLTQEAADFLKMAVKSKYNIFISGGTGSGKTTFLNALSEFIDNDERVITIEDAAELQINHVKNLVRLEARDANIEGKNEVTIRDLIRASLRMRPDRIIVGEVRGKETLDMVQAMSTGHDGSLSTGHGNSPKDMMTRLETMILMGIDMPVAAIRQQLTSAIDIIIHLGRLRDKTRRVLQIAEVVGVSRGEVKFNKLFEFAENAESNGLVLGELKATGNKLVNTQIILWLAKGILIIVAASWLFYGNIYFSILMSPWLYLYIRENSKNNKRKERQQLALQFKDAMTAVSFALNAGYSVENSFKEALEELKMLYGRNAVIVKSFSEIATRIHNNENIENVLKDFARKSDVEEIQYFSEIFGYAKRSGGDMITIIKDTTSLIREKIELDSEIKTIISGKKQEQGIMSIMPFAMVGYLRFTSYDFIAMLYGNIAGRIFMSVCLIVVIVADYIAKRIVNIEI